MAPKGEPETKWPYQDEPTSSIPVPYELQSEKVALEREEKQSGNKCLQIARTSYFQKLVLTGVVHLVCLLGSL